MEPTALEIEESKDVSDPQAKTSGASVHSTAIGIAKKHRRLWNCCNASSYAFGFHYSKFTDDVYDVLSQCV